MINPSLGHIESRVQTLSPLAWTKWGQLAQMVKACEGMGELTVQLCKVVNHSPTVRSAIIDEIADVLIMVLQLREAYEPSVVDQRAEYKLDRLAKALAVT
jgi:hypothetical protein